MALAGTHIRFALDLKNKYQITDLNKYISGSLYPDSRYLTKVPRQLTHPDNLLRRDISLLTDFEKGWQTHLICDIVQSNIVKKELPQFFTQKVHGGNEAWINLTAVKILQELEVVKNFDIGKYLSFLDYKENPLGENVDIIRRYYEIFKEAYRKGIEDPLESAFATWKDLEIGEALVKKLEYKVSEFKKDTRIMEVVNNLYQKMISQTK